VWGALGQTLGIYLLIASAHVLFSIYRRSRNLPVWSVTTKEALQVAGTLLGGYPAYLVQDWLVGTGLAKAYCQSGVFSLALLWQVPLYLVISDLMFYTVHRTLHDYQFLLKQVHATHHSVPIYAMSAVHNFILHPSDAFFHAVCFTHTILFVPVDYRVHIFLVGFNAFYGLYAHEIATAWTYDLHRLHHVHYYANFGLYFMTFDRLFGTLKTNDISIANSLVGKANKDSTPAVRSDAQAPRK
jgi:sterol desaturase/sphingolipid hydroxylase (fatty acid hydroxylase superfamily)